MLRGAAALHKRTFERMLDEVGVDIIVRQPVEPTSATTAVDKVLGPRAPLLPEADAGDEEEITVVWSHGYAAPEFGAPPVPANIAAIGTRERLDAVLRCKLADVLVDETRPLGLTRIDTAQDILYNSERWKVLGTDRSGLAPIGPYILWIAVRKAGA